MKCLSKPRTRLQTGTANCNAALLNVPVIFLLSTLSIMLSSEEAEVHKLYTKVSASNCLKNDYY